MAELKVLTFNIWGLAYIDSTRIEERLSFIATELEKYDIVGLQEVWRREDFVYLVKRLEGTLPYYHYFHSGVIGNGLCVFSRHPIMCARTHPFSVYGSMQYFFDGELFAGKGILLCRILTPSGPLAFYNTHLDPRQRDSEMFEIFQFVDQTRGTDPVIMTGDYNTKPTHDAYKFLVTCLELEDVFQDDPVDTCDRASNIFTKKHMLMKPKRIDFVFYSNKTAASVELRLKGRSLALTGCIPGKDCPYSDHEGVEATFLLQQGEQEQNTSSPTQLNDSQVHHMLQMAGNISTKQCLYKTTPFSVIGQWVVIAIAMLVISLLANSLIYPILAPWGLGWVVFLGVAGAGGLGIVRVVTTLINSRTSQALEANLNEIKTFLNFNKTVGDITHEHIKEKTS